MNHLKIGVRLESLGSSRLRALPEAQRLGVRGVQADATGDLSPHKLSQTGRNAFRRLLRSHGLELTGLGCPLQRGLDRAEDQQQRIDHIKAVLDLSAQLGSDIVLVQAGRIPENRDEPRALLLTEALQALGRHGDRVGAVLALDTGLESGAVLDAFLSRLSYDTGSIKVNLDPANLVAHGFDPCESARALQGKIVHGRAKDARRGDAGRSAGDVPLGRGDVDWPHYLAVLEEIEYQGWLTVERNGGGNRVADVAADVGFLSRLMGMATPVTAGT
jgi:L-ribulose-5-phosphate 3-epimerase